MKDYRWRPIEDLSDDWQKIASSELAGLLAVWKEQIVRLKDSLAYQEFQVRLRREWAKEERDRLLAEEQEKLRARFNEVAEILLNLTRQRLEAVTDSFRQRASAINVKNPQWRRQL